MKTLLLAELTPEELERYKQSPFYQEQVLQPYQYSDLSLEYYKEYFGPEYSNHSMVVISSTGDPVLALYAYTKTGIFTHWGAPVTVIEAPFGSTGEKQLAYRALLLKLTEHFKKHAFEKFSFYDNAFLTGSYHSKIEKIQTELVSSIDLTLSEAELKSNIRKSYKSLVNWGERNLSIQLIDHTNPDYGQFIRFRDFHIHTAGRKTRSDTSWDLQFESIRNNEAYVVLATQEENLVSATLVLHGKTKAYYGVGVYDRELMARNVAVAHYNMMFSITHAKKINLKQFDLGHHDAGSENEKENNIFRFKSGFSNETTTLNKLIIPLV